MFTHSVAMRYTCPAVNAEDAAASDCFEVACEYGLKEEPGHRESAGWLADSVYTERTTWAV